ncbi:hypothetical protein PS2_034041 [Malus domestica]
MREADPAYTLLLIGSPYFSIKLAYPTLLLLLLMGKEEVSTADSYYHPIKHIGGNSQDSFQGGMLEGHMESSPMFFENAMCLRVIKVEHHKTDDAIATLVGQVIRTGYRVVIASPDKDFKQLLSEDVQLVMPLDELERWSFYTLKHYIAQYNCDPCCDLSLRCIVGDDADGVPGIQHLAPGFGQKTALKLLKKHGSLENLLNTAAVRTVGRQYAQDALTKHVDYLRRNHEILSLRRDVDVKLREEWLVTRDTSNDSATLSNFDKFLEETWYFSRQRASVSNG